MDNNRFIRVFNYTNWCSGRNAETNLSKLVNYNKIKYSSYREVFKITEEELYDILDKIEVFRLKKEKTVVNQELEMKRISLEEKK